MGFVEGYSEELISAVAVALEVNEGKRKNSSQLLKFVRGCIELGFPPGSELRRKGEELPMAECDGDEEEEEDTGADQYFEMMEIFGCRISTRESSLASSRASSDRWREVVGRSSRDSLGETY